MKPETGRTSRSIEAGSTPSAVRPARALWAALLPALCAGCDAPPRGQVAAPANGSSAEASGLQEFALDRQAPGSANQVRALEGTPGTLRYRPGCLFLEAGGGGEIGLVVPADARFDGSRLIGKIGTPDGRPIVREVGQFVSFSGPVVDNPRDGRYSCDTGRVLIADDF